jgi:hypothetical protein
VPTATPVSAISTNARAIEPTALSPLLDGLGGLQLSLPESEPAERPPAPPIILACGLCFIHRRMGRVSPSLVLDGEIVAISGALASDVVHRVVREHFVALRVCFTHDGDPARPVIGGMRLTFIVGADGAVGDVA